MQAPLDALRSWALLALLGLLAGAAPAGASPVDCAEGCEAPAASLAPAPHAASPSPWGVALAESLGLCALAAAGVAAGVLLARRA